MFWKLAATAVCSLLLANSVNADPDKSPICSTSGAESRITRGMGRKSNDLTSSCTWSTSSETYAPSSQLTVSVTCDSDFQGLLLYAVQGNNDNSKRIGTFDVPSNARASTLGCSAFGTDAPNSVLSHNGKTLSKNSQFTYHVPATATQDIVFHAIVVVNGDGFSWGVFERAAIVKPAYGAPLDAPLPDNTTLDTPLSVNTTTSYTLPQVPHGRHRKCVKRRDYSQNYKY